MKIPFAYSAMLYNIVTGFYHPVVQRRSREEILIIVCKIETLSKLNQWFFTDGQGNSSISRHFSELDKLDHIDWESIHECNFRKNADDLDRLRRYQAEFLVLDQVPFALVQELIVFNEKAQKKAMDYLKKNNCKLDVRINPNYYF